MSEQVTIDELKKRVAALALYPRGTKTYSRYLLDQAIDELAAARERIRVLTDAAKNAMDGIALADVRVTTREGAALHDSWKTLRRALAGEALADTVQEEAK